MKRKLQSLLLNVFFLIGINSACAQSYEWSKKMGGANYDRGYAIATDGLGNVYTTGFYYGTANFDSGIGVANLASSGNADVFISKLDASGNLIWAISMGGVNDDFVNSIAVDDSGNVYTTGIFSGVADFDPGLGIVNLNSGGGTSIFISKLDSSGNFVWAKNTGGTSDSRGNSIAIDALGNVYTTGRFSGTVDFDPGVGTSNLTSSGNQDIFISKLDGLGNFVWAKKMGGLGNDRGYALAIDTFGNVYTTGYFFGGVDFDPGVGVAILTSIGGGDIYISKLNTLGDFVWAKSMGGGSLDIGQSLVVDVDGNVYTTGSFFGTVDFNTGAGILNLTSTGNRDVFVSKLDSSGNFVWAKIMGGTSVDWGFSIAVDSSQNVYTAGYFYGTADFDPGIGVANFTSAGVNDAFISKLDIGGDFIWAKKIGGTSIDWCYSLVVDANQNIYTTGYFIGTVDFNPGIGVDSLVSAGGSDIFIQKFKTCFPTTSNYNVTNCGSYTVPSGDETYSVLGSQTIMDTIANSCGSDSVMTIALTIIPPLPTGIVTSTICNEDSIIINGTVYSSSNPAGIEIFNNIGIYNCDSTVSINLNVLPAITGSVNSHICINDSLVINGTTYNSTNLTGTEVFTNIGANSCDSTVVVNLSVVTIDVSISFAGNLLTSNQIGATYQWIDCNNGNSLLVDETSISYTATANGDYAVIITLNGCSDTSNCFNVNGVGLGYTEFENSIYVYPNPTKENLTIELGALKGFNISISNNLGKKNFTLKNVTKRQIKVSLEKFSKGIYFLIINKDNHQKVIKVIKQ